MYKFGENKIIFKENNMMNDGGKNDGLLIDLINGKVTPKRTLKQTNEMFIKDFLVYSYLKEMFVGIEKGTQFVNEKSTYYNKKLIDELRLYMNKPHITNGKVNNGFKAKRVSPKLVCSNIENFDSFLSRFYVFIKIIRLNLVDLYTLERSLYLMNRVPNSGGFVYRIYNNLSKSKSLLFDAIVDINDSGNLYKEFSLGMELLSYESETKTLAINNSHFVDSKVEDNLINFLKDRTVFELDFLLTCSQIYITNPETFESMFKS